MRSRWGALCDNESEAPSHERRSWPCTYRLRSVCCSDPSGARGPWRAARAPACRPCDANGGETWRGVCHLSVNDQTPVPVLRQGTSRSRTRPRRSLGPSIWGFCTMRSIQQCRSRRWRQRSADFRGGRWKKEVGRAMVRVARPRAREGGRRDDTYFRARSSAPAASGDFPLGARDGRAARVVPPL